MALGSRTAILEQQLLTESLGFPVADRAASRERGLLPATKHFDV